MSENVFERVRKIICEEVEVTESEVTLETNLREDLPVDSLTVVQLIMEIEEEFGIDVPDEDANELKTVGEIVKYIEDKAS